MSLSKNSRHIVTVDKLSPEGIGIGSIGGLPVLVDRALPGEIVDIKIIKVTLNYCVGRLLDIKRPSVERVEPFCPVFHRCGGCSLQHLDYKGQLVLKTELVRESLKNADKTGTARVLDTIGMIEPQHYRNKAQYPIARHKGRIITGFYAKRSHEIIEHTVCPIQYEEMNVVMATIREFLTQYEVSIYDETHRQGLLRHILIRAGRRSGELLIVPVITNRQFSERDRFITWLRERCPGLTGIVLNINQEQTNVILGEENVAIFGKCALRDQLGDFHFDISPTSFYQVNSLQTERVYQKVQEYADLHGEETVADLYCGIGTLSVWLARQAKIVYGIEVNEAAVRDARHNARLNGCENLEFLAGRAECMLPELAGQGKTVDVIVVDPPRKGCDETVLETIAAMQPKRLVYVSCNPATLARDLRFLSQYGFHTIEIQPVDMFPHTIHIECVANIEFRGSLPA